MGFVSQDHVSPTWFLLLMIFLKFLIRETVWYGILDFSKEFGRVSLHKLYISMAFVEMY